MDELTAQKCSMCDTKAMQPVAGKSGPTGLLWCPNCDHGRGQRVTRPYDGVGPKK